MSEQCSKRARGPCMHTAQTHGANTRQRSDDTLRQVSAHILSVVTFLKSDLRSRRDPIVGSRSCCRTHSNLSRCVCNLGRARVIQGIEEYEQRVGLRPYALKGVTAIHIIHGRVCMNKNRYEPCSFLVWSAAGLPNWCNGGDKQTRSNARPHTWQCAAKR